MLSGLREAARVLDMAEEEEQEGGAPQRVAAEDKVGGLGLGVVRRASSHLRGAAGRLVFARWRCVLHQAAWA